MRLARPGLHNWPNGYIWDWGWELALTDFITVSI